MTPIVELQGVSKNYHGVNAITAMDFKLMPGEIHALLGENGAGKSTLTKIMAGAVIPSEGLMLIDGKEVHFPAPKYALSAGIVMVYQENSLVPALSVAQNIYLGREKLFNRLRGLNIAAQQLLQGLNFSVSPSAVVSTLGAAERQLVEIARAVSQKARVIIFDEPTATLTPEEKRHFFQLMTRLKNSGVSIVFISHALEEALQYADRITILRDGEHVVTDDVAAFDRDQIIQAMVGRDLSNEIYGKHQGKAGIRSYGAKVLSIENISMGAAVKGNSFSVYAGQVTGMFGLIGSGRTETAKVICGILKRNAFHGGEIKLNGRAVRYNVPLSAVNDGIVYVTEDRKTEGFFDTMSIRDNISLGHLVRNGSGLSLLPRKKMGEIAKEWISKLNIKAISADAKVVELSGGNQQKVVVAKSLAQESKIIIFDEPTRGVDVGAIAEIHQLINGLVDQGLAVIVISSYLPEILNLSDRILVMRNGKVVEEFDTEDATEESLMYAAVH